MRENSFSLQSQQEEMFFHQLSKEEQKERYAGPKHDYSSLFMVANDEV